MFIWVTESDRAKGLFPIGTLPLCIQSTNSLTDSLPSVRGGGNRREEIGDGTCDSRDTERHILRHIDLDRYDMVRHIDPYRYDIVRHIDQYRYDIVRHIDADTHEWSDTMIQTDMT